MSASSLVYSILSNREQCVCLDKAVSQICATESEVPQGHILGPPLNRIHTINFVNSQAYCQYHFYANDSRIYTFLKPFMLENVASSINGDLEIILNI